MKSEIIEEIPWSDGLTAYDKEHFTTYMQLLDASADNATEEEMAHLILGIDPAREPERARKALRSHLDRANWMVTAGYKDLFAS
ncbi:DNA -binding domain-containing protein [Mesorhizobium sp. AaZ16]|uniref:DNA -binding domain-containing protein n=1 Tax=Mesorhizobium sp. AaZ16 TaxID=3402289 RepID=UPI00374F0357